MRSPGWEELSSGRCGLSLLDSGPQEVSCVRHCGGGPQFPSQHSLTSPSDLAEASCFPRAQPRSSPFSAYWRGFQGGLPGPGQVKRTGLGAPTLVPGAPSASASWRVEVRDQVKRRGRAVSGGLQAGGMCWRAWLSKDAHSRPLCPPFHGRAWARTGRVTRAPSEAVVPHCPLRARTPGHQPGI